MNRLYLLLLAFLSLCAVGDDDGAGDPPNDSSDSSDGDEGAGDGEGDDDSSIDDILDADDDSRGGDDDGDGGAPTRQPSAVRRERERADRAERELEIERAAARRSAPPPADPRTQRDPDVEREDAYLEQVRREGTPEQMQQAQWYVNSNRQQRDATRKADFALRQMDDMRDKTAFERLEFTKPKVFKKYAKRVEEALAQTRAAGQNAPRNAILRLLIGNDILDDNVKKKTSKRAPAADGSRNVDRGALPSARTDTRRGATSEREKRRARLENQPI